MGSHGFEPWMDGWQMGDGRDWTVPAHLLCREIDKQAARVTHPGRGEDPPLIRLLFDFLLLLQPKFVDLAVESRSRGLF